MITGRTEIFGILNYTPNSFSDGGLYYTPEEAMGRAQELFDIGADYVDIGAESTRPGATPLSHTDEWDRLVQVLPNLIPAFPGRISVDTRHPQTVQKAAKEIGFFIINDVTGFNNHQMILAASENRLPLIVSHLPKSTGQDIQQAHSEKEIDSVQQVLDELMAKRELLLAAGVPEDMITLDPGIGFGKIMEINWELLEFAKLIPDINVMLGYSRKRFLGEQRMTPETNLAAAEIAIRAGTKYLRVHDVAEHRQLIDQLA